MTKNKDKENETCKCTCVCEECGNKAEMTCKACECDTDGCKDCQCEKCGGKCSCVCECSDECNCEECTCDGKCQCNCKCEEDKELHEKLEKTQQDLDEERRSRVQLLADFVNYRKRVENDMADMKVTANNVILEKIIEVVDDFDRAIQLENDKIDPKNDFYQGIIIIRRKFAELLTNYGLEEVKTEIGGDFDPTTMEALTTAPVSDKKQSNKIIHVAGKGYINKENKKIFRAAKVIIGK